MIRWTIESGALFIAFGVLLLAIFIFIGAFLRENDHKFKQYTSLYETSSEQGDHESNDCEAGHSSFEPRGFDD